MDLCSIACPTNIWQGDLDTTTPAAMASHLAGAIPGAALHVVPGEAHLSLPFRHNRSILGSVAAGGGGG